MSNTKKVVKIKESALVDLIDSIVEKSIGLKKKEWLNEQANKGDKLALLERRIIELEEKKNKK
jgi:hypothetical protein